MSAEAHGESNKRTGQKKKSGSRGSAGQKWCSVYKTTTHHDAESTRKGIHPQACSTHSAATGALTRLKNTEKEPVDDDFDRGFSFELAKIQEGPPTISGVDFPTVDRRKDVSRIRCKEKALGIAGNITLRITIAFFDLELLEIPESLHEQQNQS